MSVRKPVYIFLLAALFILLLKTGAEAANTVKEPAFSVPAGLYTEDFELTLSAEDEAAKIFYTIDGSLPNPGNNYTYEYKQPINISSNALREAASNYFCGTVIRAVTQAADGSMSKTATASYFVNSDIFNRYKLPIISITTDNENLYDPTSGIMAQWNTQYKGKDWERPIHFEYFDKEGKQQISMDAGIRLHGAASRDWAFKSFRIYARSEYDTKKKLEYDFFSDSVVPSLVKTGENKGEPITEFKNIILRTSGNEGTAGDGVLFRDALSQALMMNTHLDLQGYAPAVTFINGEFYGIHNIRERYDEKYIENHYNVDQSKIVIYDFRYDEEGNQIPMISSGEDSDLAFYSNFLDFIKNNDLSVKQNYDKVKELMDIENFTDYEIINIFGVNRDWPGNNCKAWRIRTEYAPDADYGLDGRLRWLPYDMDFNFGLYFPTAYSMDFITEATKTGGKEYPTPDGSTLILRKLLANREFKTYFCQRFLDLMNTNFDKAYVYSLIDKMSANYAPAIDEFKNRYNLLNDWQANLGTVKNFFDNREALCKSQLAAKLNLGRLFNLSIETIDNNGPLCGKVNVNTVTIDSKSNGVVNGIWTKSYYSNIPTMLTAVPDEGYEFVAWSGSSDSTDPVIDAASLVKSGNEVGLTPIFKPVGNTAEEASEVKASAYNSSVIAVTPINTAAEVMAPQVTNDNEQVYYVLCIIILSVIFIIFAVYWLVKRNKRKYK